MITVYRFENRPPGWTPPRYETVDVEMVAVELQTNTDPEDPSDDEMVIILRVKE